MYPPKSKNSSEKTNVPKPPKVNHEIIEYTEISEIQIVTTETPEVNSFTPKSVENKSISNKIIEDRDRSKGLVSPIEGVDSESDLNSDILSNASFSSSKSEIDDTFNQLFPGQVSRSIEGSQAGPELNSTFNISTYFNESNASFKNPLLDSNIKDGNLPLSKFTSQLLTDQLRSKSVLNFDRQSIQNNEKLTNIIKTLNDKITTLKNENLELKKELKNQNCLKSLENTIKIQRDQLDEMNQEELRNELKLEEATDVLNELSTKLENSDEKLKLVEGLYSELKKPTELDENEMYQFPPKEVYAMYKKQCNLFKKQSNHVKYLLEEKKGYKKQIVELRTENEDLRLKVVNLTENDIDKRILDFTINENKRLERKISVQKERNIGLGFEFREEMKKLEKLEIENKNLHKKIHNMEKNKTQENEEILMVENFNDDWETLSEQDLSEDISGNTRDNSFVSIKSTPAHDRTKKSSEIIYSDESGIAKIKITLEKSEVLNGKSMLEKNKVEKSALEKNKCDKSTSPDKSSDRTYTPVTRKKICKFYIQERCKFGDRYFNLHPARSGHQSRYVHPWKSTLNFPNNSFVPSQASNLALYGGYLTPNRFQPLMDIDLGEHSQYWSLPHNPRLNNSRSINFQQNYGHYSQNKH